MTHQVKTWSLALALLAALPATAALASGDGSPGFVGEVTMSVGKAWIERADGSRERVRRGTPISVNDRIDTESSGLVHIGFIDDAKVSVRGSSTLEVLRYDWNPAAPAQSAVKFNLVEGVFRGISGDAAKNARENFRLNTPIAAIGVRGTDFVVSADDAAVRAFVTEGAIVITPYSSECLVNALGPCSQNGFELAGGASQILQISADRRDPELLPLSTSGLPESLVGEAVVAPEPQQAAPADTSASERYADSVATRTVNETIATRAVTTTPETKPPVPVPLPEFTPDVAISTEVLTQPNHQLVWGRYAPSSTNERITIYYGPDTPVAVFGGRQPASGNNHYALFRTENGPQVVQPGLGVVAFALNSAQANYTSGGATSMMDVNGGKLSIDFVQNTFATSLSLNHAATGAIELVDSGRLFSGGYFHSRSDTQVVAGAVSLDGAEAGYFFEKVLQNGNIEGLTLWGRQP